ncbi:Uncharacterised protein [Halioglobus japonicus]|nr:Uncharacterised protein [Halioglobus japonicus]
MIMIRVIAIVLLLSAPGHAVAQDRFTSKLALPGGQTAVIAEGDFEPRSIGSFSVRLYEAAEAPDETTFFIAGLIRARDGVVEKAIVADVKGDQQPEIIVVVRSVGTGSYLSAAAFAFSKDALTFEGAVEDLAADTDPVSALRKKLATSQ